MRGVRKLRRASSQVVRVRTTTCAGLAALAMVCACSSEPPAAEAPVAEQSSSPSVEGSAKPAARSSLTVRDPRRDVESTTDVRGESETRRAPNQVDSDLTSATFRHTNTRVQARISFVDLRRPLPMTDRSLIMNEVGVTMRLPEQNHYYDVSLHAARHRATTTLTEWLPTGEDRNVRCTITARVDCAKNLVSIDLPRTCVDRPPWIRVGATAVANFIDKPETWCIDDALRNGFIFLKPKLSPPLPAGP